LGIISLILFMKYYLKYLFRDSVKEMEERYRKIKEKIAWKEYQVEKMEKLNEEDNFVRFRSYKPITSPTPPPSPQSYWTGKPIVSDQIRKSNHKQCDNCPKK